MGAHTLMRKLSVYYGKHSVYRINQQRLRFNSRRCPEILVNDPTRARCEYTFGYFLEKSRLMAVETSLGVSEMRQPRRLVVLQSTVILELRNCRKFECQLKDWCTTEDQRVAKLVSFRLDVFTSNNYSKKLIPR